MIFTRGLSAPEGPLLLPGGGWLIVEMGSDRGCVTRISPDGADVHRLARTGRPNGLALDRHGLVWVAESYPNPSLLIMTSDGQWEVVSTGATGTPFLFPNDLCFGPDGMLYMTDSGIGLDDWAPGGNLKENWADLDIDGRVFRIDPQSKTIDQLDAGLRFPNGIAVGPDGRLYVNEMIGGAVYRYAIDADHAGPRETFGHVNDPATKGLGPSGFRGPDGMKFGADGRLFVTVYGQSDVTVLGRDGEVTDRVRTQGKFPSNLAFGPPTSERIYVTEVEFGDIEVFEVGTDGATLFG